MKKGFTLIELLAVIVILAIIALIATPIVLNIINDSRESSTLRSADFYLDAVEYTIADATLNKGGLTDGEYPITKDGDLCMTSLNAGVCDTDKTLKVEVNGEKPSSGTITIARGNIINVSIDLNNKTIIKNEKGELVYQDEDSSQVEPTLENLCTLQNGYAANTIGAKYSCNFGGGARNFYILELGTNPVTGSTLESDEVALILEGNYDKTTQPWCSQSGSNPSHIDCNADGLTSKLDSIAGVWTKLEREQIGLPSALQIIVANNPYKNTIESAAGIQSWLYNWDWGDTVSGYWTSTPYAEYSNFAWGVDYSGNVNVRNVGNDGSDGVRPVVNIKL